MDSAGTTDRSSSRPWSVSAEAPAVLRASIVAACDHVGLLFVTDDTADVTVAVTETSTDDELAPTRWHVIAHRGASKVASSFDSGDDLAAEAARAALRVLVQSGALLDEGTVPIVLASYSKSAAPRSGRYFRILAEAERPDHEDWEATVGVGLERLRQTLQEDFRTRSVTLWLECTLALATRAGLVFHDGTGFSIRCETLGRSLTGAVNSKDSVFDEPVVRVTHDGASAGEVHLLLSASQDVFGLYGKWRWSPVGVAGRVVHLMPSGGAPSSNVIADTRDVLAWAAVARRAITAAQRDLNTEGHAERTTRVFIAGPAAMAVALGRQLNSLGTVILMDRDKRTDAYIPRFTVRT